MGIRRIGPAVPHLPARYADHLFWMGRYVERAGALARLIAAAESGPNERDWRTVVRYCADDPLFPRIDRIAVRFHYMLARESSVSVITLLDRARENARVLRAVISAEAWTLLNVLHQRVGQWTLADLEKNLVDRCNGLADGCCAQGELTHNQLDNEQACRFHALGVAIERADHAARLLGVCCGKDAAQRGGPTATTVMDAWPNLRRWLASPQVAPGQSERQVAAVLVLSDGFPRSIKRCLQQAEAAASQMDFGSGRGARAIAEIRSLAAGLNGWLEKPWGANNAHQIAVLVQRRLAIIAHLVTQAVYDPDDGEMGFITAAPREPRGAANLA